MTTIYLPTLPIQPLHGIYVSRDLQTCAISKCAVLIKNLPIDLEIFVKKKFLLSP